MSELADAIDSPWNKHLQDLHRYFFETAADQCLLWVNPAQFDVFAEETVAQDRLVRINIHRPDLDEKLLPYLVPLDLSRSPDADLFKKSVAIAWEAWTLDSLKAYNGQPIGGWIHTDASPQALARYWASNCYVHSVDNGHVLLRIHDPGVRQWLWRSFSSLQKIQMLGPARSIHAFGREHQMMCHQADASAAAPSLGDSNAPSRLQLAPAQWGQVGDYSVLHRAWLRYCERDPEVRTKQFASAAWEHDILSALDHASQYGIEDEQDRDLFAFHALQMGPNFHFDKRLQPVWAMVQTGEYYGGACEHVTALPTDRLHEYLQPDQ